MQTGGGETSEHFRLQPERKNSVKACCLKMWMRGHCMTACGQYASIRDQQTTMRTATLIAFLQSDVVYDPAIE